MKIKGVFLQALALISILMGISCGAQAGNLLPVKYKVVCGIEVSNVVWNTNIPPYTDTFSIHKCFAVLNGSTGALSAQDLYVYDNNHQLNQYDEQFDSLRDQLVQKIKAKTEKMKLTERQASMTYQCSCSHAALTCKAYSGLGHATSFGAITNLRMLPRQKDGFNPGPKEFFPIKADDVCENARRTINDAAF